MSSSAKSSDARPSKAKSSHVEALLDGGIALSNEFATAIVSIDNSANGVRLRVEDPTTGAAIFLDPYELQSLAYLTVRDIEEFMRPSFQERETIDEMPTEGFS
jgi:hypothetical protein